MADISVSVILPIYCRSDTELGWFDECLASLVGQGMQEIVMWNDASPTDPSDIVAKYAGQERLLYGGDCKHRGVSAARNIAANTASGELLFPIDCDDVLVPGALEEFLSHWDGRPVYSDLYKFGLEDVSHYQLLEFMCDHVKTKVGVAGIGVLHSKEQWSFVGGWDEDLDLYEDGEYNARLFLKYCAVHIKRPLYGYRMHDFQRTKLKAQQSVQMTKKVLSMIQRYGRSIEMGCCPGGRRGDTQPISGQGQSVAPRVRDMRTMDQKVASLPGASGGKVWAEYKGGQGMGKHYYRGPHTRFAYKVKHGGLYEVDQQDTSDPDDPGWAQKSMLVRVKGKETPAPSPPIPAPQPVPAKEPVRRAARVPVSRKPVEEIEEFIAVLDDFIEEEDVDTAKGLPDISKVPYRQLVTLSLTPAQAKDLLRMEMEGRARKKHVAYLKRRVTSE